jgi:hypothetical protein
MAELEFTVAGAGSEPLAATPHLSFDLVLHNRAPERTIENVILQTQIRIPTALRVYEACDLAPLRDLFGPPEQWGNTLRSLLWASVSVSVPRFADRRQVKLLIPCTHDFDLATTKYFDALGGGDIPLEFLFSGSVFYRDRGGPLQIDQIAWSKEATYSLPAATWQDLMRRFYQDSVWLRVPRALFDRLVADRLAHGHRSLQDALVHLVADKEPLQ